jgi:hypothetical protein
MVYAWYYLKSLLVGTSIKLVPNLGHTKLVWYLIPMLIPLLIPTFDHIYQTNINLVVPKGLYLIHNHNEHVEFFLMYVEGALLSLLLFFDRG